MPASRRASDDTNPPVHGPIGRRMLGSLLRSFGYAALITPVGLVALASAVLGRARRATERWRRLSTRLLAPGSELPSQQPGAIRVIGHAIISALVGLVALVLIGAIGLMVVRGAFYGLVDRGPYDNSWGGPSLAGAWLAHAALSAAGAAVALTLLRGVSLLHLRLNRWLLGGPAGWWTLPVSVVLCAAAAVFIIAWTRQL